MRGRNSKGFKIRSMAPTINQRRSCSGVHLGVQVQNEPEEQQVKDLLAGKPSGEATQAEEENIEKQARQRGFMKLTFYLYRKAVREGKKRGGGMQTLQSFMNANAKDFFKCTPDTDGKEDRLQKRQPRVF